MEKKNRNVWIAVAAIVIVCCSCAIVIGAAAIRLVAAKAEEIQADLEFYDLDADFSAQVEEAFFEVGQAAYLDITNFAGSVSVRPSEDNLIHVVAVKKASGGSRLDRISVAMNQQNDRVVVRTKKANNLGNAYVELRITAPPRTELEIHTGAGTIELRGMTGSIDAHSGVGAIQVTGAAGPVRLGTGVGTIQYQGTPTGHCSFETGAGEVDLRLPASPDVRVDLNTGMGTVSVGYHVDGLTSPRDVRGIIGDGSQASIYANTGLGGIQVRP